LTVHLLSCLAECSSATRPEECRSLIDGVKCIFTDRACVRFDPFVSYKQSFLSFVKNESPKSMSECRNTALRQALQICEEQNDCMSCTSEPGCGWCPSGDQCLPNDGECVDGQVMLTAWEKCSSSRDPSPPRPCGMANDCRSCKLLPHCNWYAVEGKPACIPLEDEILLRKEQLDRELDRVASSSLPLRLPTTPPPIPPGQNLSYCPLPCSSLHTCGECLQEQKCMWCPSTSRCINMEAYALSFAYGQCHSWVAGHAHGFAFSKSCRIGRFNVRVFNFTTPITIQVSFAQSPPINWVLFFVIFAACFIVLLVVAGLLWMIKLRIEVYRRNQRRIDEIEHMASRPFSSVKLELTSPHCYAVVLLRKEQLDRELDRVASSSLPLRLPTTPPPIPPGQNLSYCPLPCSSLHTCGECLQEQKCMWCPSTSRCINMEAYALSFAYGQCHSWVAGHAHGFAFSKSCRIESSNCSSHKTCAECQLSPECGWLDDGSRTGLGTCTRGSARGPLERSPDFHPHQWYFTDCPACQCNGHSMCNETRHTLGGVQEVCGECQNNTMGKHCEICAPGYHGDPRNGDNCAACQCNGQADTCDHITGSCHCRTKGVSGASCDRCDQKYYGQPKNGTPCYYELSVDFIFTFKLKNEDKDKHATEIYLFSIPHKKDTDVTFQISCDGGSQANVALNITSSLFESTPRRMMLNTTCDSKGFRRVYVGLSRSSELCLRNDRHHFRKF
ncbi:plexin repeat-containing domain protein, partial [Cooperia oncophora]